MIKLGCQGVGDSVWRAWFKTLQEEKEYPWVDPDADKKKKSAVAKPGKVRAPSKVVPVVEEEEEPEHAPVAPSLADDDRRSRSMEYDPPSVHGTIPDTPASPDAFAMRHSPEVLLSPPRFTVAGRTIRSEHSAQTDAAIPRDYRHEETQTEPPTQSEPGSLLEQLVELQQLQLFESRRQTKLLERLEGNGDRLRVGMESTVTSMDSLGRQVAGLSSLWQSISQEEEPLFLPGSDDEE